MIVVGVDPASGSKGSYLFAPEADGLDLAGLDPARLRSTLGRLRQEHPDLLICWDAPLTGPPHPSRESPGNLIERAIETRFARTTKGVAGVSVRGYAQLSHWVVSRNVLGLPRVGIYDAEYNALPFTPCFADPPPRAGHHVVEVHPTLAAWVWLGSAFRPYKGDLKATDKRAAIHANWGALRHEVLAREELRRFGDALELPQLKSGLDDALDARIAWLLGRLWLGQGGAQLEGSEADGAFLMPKR